jgi:hypothetical protein
MNRINAISTMGVAPQQLAKAHLQYPLQSKRVSTSWHVLLPLSSKSTSIGGIVFYIFKRASHHLDIVDTQITFI